MASHVKRHEQGRGSHLADYRPLISLIVLTLLTAGALQLQAPSATLFMHYFMGLFLVIYSMFKIFDLSGYADGFEMYDLLAKRVRAYAYVYPFIELALGLAYLAFWYPLVTYIVTLVVFGFSALGVFDGVRRGLDLDCPCMGSVLKVPLSTVGLVENIGMSLMALGMLIMRSA
ncbi:MAG: MauE/DoxX family redox-associated membrane protein [Gammaproteobacteria bacterium]